jgi:hypothetical protein
MEGMEVTIGIELSISILKLFELEGSMHKGLVSKKSQ